MQETLVAQLEELVGAAKAAKRLGFLIDVTVNHDVAKHAYIVTLRMSRKDAKEYTIQEVNFLDHDGESVGDYQVSRSAATEIVGSHSVRVPQEFLWGGITYELSRVLSQLDLVCSGAGVLRHARSSQHW